MYIKIIYMLVIIKNCDLAHLKYGIWGNEGWESEGLTSIFNFIRFTVEFTLTVLNWLSPWERELRL